MRDDTRGAEDPADPPHATRSFDARAVRRLLPHRDWMALLDRVESYDDDERRITGIKVLGQDEPTLAGYLPGRRVFPGTLIIEVLAQTCGLLMNVEYHVRRGGRIDHPDDIAALPLPPLSVLAESKVTQRGIAQAGDEIRLDCRVVLQRQDLYSFKVRASCRGAAIAEGTILLAYPAYMAASAGAARSVVGGTAAGSALPVASNAPAAIDPVGNGTASSMSRR